MGLVLVLVTVAVLDTRQASPHILPSDPQAKTVSYPSGNIANYRPSALTIDQIRRIGAIGNLNLSIEISIHGIPTRLLAWPGMGAIESAIHVLTVKPGTGSSTYSYPVSEEAMVCIQGKGEIFLRGRWVEIEAGDVAYFPEGVPHAVRNSISNARNFVLVTQISPPQLDLYANSGFYDIESGRFNYAAIDEAEKEAEKKPGTLTTATEVRYRTTHPELRAWNLSNSEIRRAGALFNLFSGAEFRGIGVPMRIILFPGFGTRNAGLHTGYIPKGSGADTHTHPISDDIIMQLGGAGSVYIDGKSVTIQTLDATIAPVLVMHGGAGQNPQTGLMAGFGAPPQQDLYMRTSYYNLATGQYTRPEFKVLEVPEALQYIGCWSPFPNCSNMHDVYRDATGKEFDCGPCGTTRDPNPSQCSPVVTKDTHCWNQ